jgi:pyruvate/2-oxoglutarate dehydrogenase complex dihydrolipoamide acyltransferase (E2) component
MEMPINFPKFGDMTDGIVLQWLRNEGDEVTAGEILVELETAKSIVEIEAPAAGTLTTVAAPEGTTVDVGDLLATLAVPD